MKHSKIKKNKNSIFLNKISYNILYNFKEFNYYL